MALASGAAKSKGIGCLLSLALAPLLFVVTACAIYILFYFFLPAIVNN